MLLVVFDEHSCVVFQTTVYEWCRRTTNPFFKCQTVKSKPTTTYTGLNVLLLVVLHLKRFMMMMFRFLICQSFLGNTLLTRENRYENATTVQRIPWRVREWNHRGKCLEHVLRWVDSIQKRKRIQTQKLLAYIFSE
jgi:hypothetical protein